VSYTISKTTSSHAHTLRASRNSFTQLHAKRLQTIVAPKESTAKNILINITNTHILRIIPSQNQNVSCFLRFRHTFRHMGQRLVVSASVGKHVSQTHLWPHGSKARFGTAPSSRHITQSVSSNIFLPSDMGNYCAKKPPPPVISSGRASIKTYRKVVVEAWNKKKSFLFIYLKKILIYII
jgi:hypothetical protein